MTTPDTKTRDHGGNLDAAMIRFGGSRAEWLDLSTGINPEPYPVPAIPAEAWAALPRKADMARLIVAAREAYGCPGHIVPMNGAQGAIQMVPMLRRPGRAAVLGPTYNEHAAALRAHGWEVTEVASLAALAGADLAVVVNPNNPDGRRSQPGALRDLAGRVGLLVVDESFADPEPELSIAPSLEGGLANVVVLRSFGKFYGLAGLRLGFALAEGDLGQRLAELAGPWPVSGPAIEIASAALTDRPWQEETIRRLSADAARLDALAGAAGWRLIGGTPLFRSYACPGAKAAQETLAARHIWSRIFPYSDSWIRLGLPPCSRWGQLERAFQAL
ncbi:threonine-phosphate decarboxylase CobD [Salipiger sp. PrR002]|uniref:threonine-phosphate decarboxylase CobD n=1 Tax=Salipiger sp. PrR002 TaxID=2706489 RepID=UPI0013B98772|nr:threonine-phosphate decarboxylase CobD [Salipiger sp. PrR002]NDW00343.1 threonine-phosphate decarboxylase [Salipiger sp. PrR002]NDW58398.1 threonine-phosphate decarboxylase [Salipiger sp. PrR004]